MRVAETSFACACGTLRGHVKADTPAIHFLCHCRSCAAAERLFDQPDPGDVGVAILWIAPDRMVLDSGEDHLQAVKLSKGELLRWYADCCNTPMFNFILTPKVFILGLLAARVDETADLGPHQAHYERPQPDGTRKSDGTFKLVNFVAARTGSALLKRRWPDHPLLTTGHTPIRAPRQVSDAERKAAGL